MLLIPSELRQSQHHFYHKFRPLHLVFSAVPLQNCVCLRFLWHVHQASQNLQLHDFVALDLETRLVISHGCQHRAALFQGPQPSFQTYFVYKNSLDICLPSYQNPHDYHLLLHCHLYRPVQLERPKTSRFAAAVSQILFNEYFLFQCGLY